MVKWRMASLDDWCDWFANLYRDTDRPRKSRNLWLQVVTRCANLGEDVRLAKYAEAVHTLADVCAWLLSFAGRLRQDRRSLGGYSEWILKKYPRACHVCGKRVCDCSAHRDVSENRQKQAEYLDDGVRRFKRAYKSLQGPSARRPKTLDGVVKMFHDIYGGTLYGMPIEQVAFHLQEEVGEVSLGVAMQHDLQLKRLLGGVDDWADIVEHVHARSSDDYVREIDKEIANEIAEELAGLSREDLVSRLNEWLDDDIRAELADVFSWVTALLYKLDQLIRNSQPLAREVSLRREGTIRAEDDRISLAYLLAKAATTGPPGNPPEGYVHGNAFSCPFCGRAKCSTDCIAKYMLERVVQEAVKRAKRYQVET